MKRAEIQLPDAVYEHVEKLAQAAQSTISTVLRKVVEESLRSTPPLPLHVADTAPWSLPDGQDLGEFLRPVEDWRTIANEE